MRHQTFICYAHKDEASLERLLVHLKPYTRDSTIEVWSDKRIKPGGSWKKEIRSALARAQAAILLVSADFIGSDFIHENELPPLLQAADEKGLQILWVPVSSCAYERTPIAKYQAVSDPAQPLDVMTAGERERVWTELCRKLLHATWGLNLRITSSSVEADGRMLDIKGKAVFRPRESAKDSIPTLLAALSQMNLRLVPFVYNDESGWWAQPKPTPDAKGNFGGQVFIGRDGSVDIGKSFEVRVCAIDAGLPGFQNGSQLLPAVRIESNTIIVKRAS